MLEMWADNRFGTWPRGRTVFDRRPHAATAKALAAGYDLGFAIAGILFLLVIAVALALLPRRPAGPPIPDETEEEIIGVAIAEENI